MGAKRTSVILAVIALTMCAVAQNPTGASQQTVAQPPTAATIGPAKIAFVSIQQIIAASDEGKDELVKWQLYVDKVSAEIIGRQKELADLRNQLEVQGPKLTDVARTELTYLIEGKDTNLQRLREDAQKGADQRRQIFQNAIFRKAMPVIAKIAKEKALSVVHFIDESHDAYVDDSLVITDEVMNAYNLAYPVAITPAASVKK